MPTFQELGLEPKEYHKNPRKIEEEDIGKLKSSLGKFGDLSGIVHNLETDEIISGNQRSFKVFDIANCEVEFTQRNETPDEQKTVALGYLIHEGKRYSYRQVRWSEEWAEEANIAANAAGGTWDEVVLSTWDNSELLEKWNVNFEWEGEEELPEEEDFDDSISEQAKTFTGDLYELHSLERGLIHRVQCGDSCEADVVEKTLQGEEPILMVTDPPYGVEYDPTWRKDLGLSAGINMGTVRNDDNASWTEAYSLFGGSTAYVWHDGLHAKTIQQDLEACNFKMVSQIIWAKPSLAISRGDYHWQHEPCWYAVRKGKTHNWQGSRKETTLWSIEKGGKEKTGHGTQKPLECMARPIRNNTAPNESVYDPFLGSGTTLIAAEQLGRNCFGQELDEKYMDIIVKRWVKYMRDNDLDFKVLLNGEDITSAEWLIFKEEE